MVFWFGYILLSYLFADFIAGLFHWWEDQYATEDMPIIGVLISGPNSLHHSSPSAFLRGSYWGRNWTTILPAIVAACLASFFSGWLVLPLLFASQANEIHGWSHQKCNRLIRCLQETELLASVKHHAKHHVDPFSRRYCVMSGWLNPILDELQFWASLESIIFYSLGLVPKHSLGRNWIPDP